MLGQCWYVHIYKVVHQSALTTTQHNSLYTTTQTTGGEGPTAIRDNGESIKCTQCSRLYTAAVRGLNDSFSAATQVQVNIPPQPEPKAHAARSVATTACAHFALPVSRQVREEADANVSHPPPLQEGLRCLVSGTSALGSTFRQAPFFQMRLRS